MKGKFNVQFLVKQEPNREKGKTKFHYVGLVTDKAVVNDLAKEGTAIDFWSEDDLNVAGNALYECLLDVTSVGENQIVRFVKFVGDAVEIPF